MKENPKTIKVTKFKAVVRKYYDDTETLAENLDSEQEARDAILKNRQRIPYRSAVLREDFQVVPYTAEIPYSGLPKRGDRIYVPSGLGRLIGEPGLLAQTGISGGLAKVDKVYEKKQGSGNWFVDFDEIGATYNINTLIHLQEKLKKKYKSKNAEAIIDLDEKEAIELEADARNALEDDPW